MKYQDYYGTLGVSREASQHDIKRAYRKLAHKYHPDVSKESDAEARFKDVGEAYEALKNPERRAAYDDLGRYWHSGDEFSPPPGWGQEFRFGQGGHRGSADFSDFFASIFGSNAGSPSGFGPRGRSRTRRRRGADSEVTLRLSLEEAYAGGERYIELTSQGGPNSGRTNGSRKIKVKIPAGIYAGQKIRLSGQGEQATDPRFGGDLYLKIDFVAHRFFRIDDRDVYLDLPITPWEAALGAAVKVPTLAGEVELRIPAGSQSGRKLRLKGKGLGRSGKRGDQFVALQIMTPAALGDAAKEVYRNMEKELPFNPREGLW